jgi:ubiquinone/menaquinone biosynthesis C-methylase UbiE
VSGAEPDLAAFGGVKAGTLCLDVGAGKGRASRPLLAAGARVVLLERDGARLAEAAAALAGPASFVRGDARSLPFAAGTFDAVVIRALVHHLEDPAHALREAARVARPGGTVLLVDKLGPDDIQARARRNALERLRHSGHVWSWSERELRTLAESARLEVEAFAPWSETRDAEEWIARGNGGARWSSLVRELLGGAAVVEERWGALRLRKEAARR